jgi:hypothetical protein
MHQPLENEAYGLGMHDPWDRILGLIEQDLEERQSRKLFVEVRGKYGSCKKEIGELSAEERRSLYPVLREHIVERPPDRHLAEQGRVDLLERRHPYTREIRDLTPEDLPALIEADRLRNEEEHHRGRTESFREAQANLGQPIVAELAKAAKASHR